MRKSIVALVTLGLWLGGLTLVCLGITISADEASFQNVIRPILAKNCFECHGPDEGSRKADLRLDLAESAYAKREGAGAIVPGDPQASIVWQRVITDDPDDQMPPPESHKRLEASEIDAIRQWIESGAEYREHWAFLPPVRPDLPEVADVDWPFNAIDFFVLKRLEAEGLEPSPEADRFTLIRRLYLDLVGVLPSVEAVDGFVRDTMPGAYGRLVDRLLASPQYGERWARSWLDLARYSDTNGYEKDRERSIWPYRDWVIDALNADVPFDQFTIEQLAGDMLPNATEAQRIATGFHRNTMLNEEGGIDPLEFRFYAMVDRVATTGTVWLGLTTGCAQCHTHKYDPISHNEYYSLMALLNNADEPDLIVQDPARQRARDKQLAELEALTLGLADQFPLPEGTEETPSAHRAAFSSAFQHWVAETEGKLTNWSPLEPKRWETTLARLEVMEDRSVFASGDATKRDVYKLTFALDEIEFPVAALRLEALPDDRLPARGPGRAFYEGRKGDFFLSELEVRVGGQPQAFSDGSRSYGKISVGSGNGEAVNVFDGDGSTGWSTSGREGEEHYLVLNFKQPIEKAEELEVELLFERQFVASLGRFRISVAGRRAQAVDLSPKWEAAVLRGSDSWDEAEMRGIKQAFILATPDLAEARKGLEKERRRVSGLVTTMVLQERAPDHPRPTTRHHRGEYLSPRELVEPGIPAVLARDGSVPTNRLELAKWLVSASNPLVGRVTANRAWRSFFGAGLLRTSGDFGTQSDRPSHPELLDWLAVEAMESGWSLKRLHRLIVSSRTYRQSARLTPELRQRDPANRLLSRGPRHRLEGELVRDALLSGSGLMSPHMRGPSVRPPQPAAVTGLAYGGTRWTPDEGEARYRRSLYTFSKRTAPFAAYNVFDAPSGENCTARRNRSNTPLQALTLLNDAMFLEMARALADQVMGEHDSPQARATAIVRRLLIRPPGPDELEWLIEYQEAQKERIERGELAAEAICGEALADKDRASWVMVARAVMNFDETISK